MPLDQQNSDQTTSILISYGDSEIKCAATELFPGLDWLFKREALAVRLFIFEHQERVSRSGGPNEAGKGAGALPPNYLRTLESGQLRLKHSSSVLPTRFDYAASFMWQS